MIVIIWADRKLYYFHFMFDNTYNIKTAILVIAISLFAIAAHAQTNQPPLKKSEDQKPTQEINKDLKYYCPKCSFSYSQAGPCSMHGIPLMLPDQKYCPACYCICCDSTGKGETENCHKCGTQLKKIDPPKNDDKGKEQKPKVNE
jgi:hypothetical protein